MIAGRVSVSRSDTLPERLRVVLQSRGMTVGDTFTDEQGNFIFQGLPANPYWIVIEHEDYQPVREVVVVDPSINERYYVRIFMYARSFKQVEKPPAPASGGNPHLVDVAEYTKSFPKNVRKEFEKGAKNEKQGKLDDAIRHYEKTIALAPDFYPAHNNLGTVYMQKQDFESARREFATAVKLNQADPQPYFNLGNVCLLTQRYPEGLEWVQQGLTRHPNAAFGHFLLGSIYARTGRYTEAEGSLKQALHHDATMAEAHLQLVNLYLQQARAPDAITELQAFLKEFPDDPRAPQAKTVLERLKSRK